MLKDDREIIGIFLKYYKNKGFKFITPDSLINEVYPTNFTVSHGAKLYQEIIKKRQIDSSMKVMTVQPIIRTDDALEPDKGGDGFHLSFFRLAIAHSLNCEEKEKNLENWFNFLDSIGIKSNKLWGSICGGGKIENLHITLDKISLNFLLNHGFDKKRIKMIHPKKPGGIINICSEPFMGPVTELFLEKDGRLIEIGLFIDFCYERVRQDGSISIPEKYFGNSDEPTFFRENHRNIFAYGYGIERLEMCLNDYETIYQCREVNPLVKILTESVPTKSETVKKAIYKIADQIRGITILACEGAIPGNRGRNYVFRKYIIDTLLQAEYLKICSLKLLGELIEESIKLYKDDYPYIQNRKEVILDVIKGEMNRKGKAGIK